MVRPPVVIIAVAAAILALVTAAPSEALPKRANAGSSIGDCLGDNGTDHECDDDGIICYCCYSDGCWICGFDDDGNAYQDCVWEPSNRPSALLKRLLQKLPPAGTLQPLQPVPQGGTTSRLPVLKTPGTLTPAP